MEPTITITEMRTMGSVEKSRVLVDDKWVLTILGWENRYHIITNRQAEPDNVPEVRQKSHPTFGAAEQAVRQAVEANAGTRTRESR